MKNGLIVNTNGTKEWYLNDQLHSTDGPALEDSDGTKYWYFYGQRHRIDGPALEYYNGNKYWYLLGKSYSETEWKRMVKLLVFI
jgi:hypothetical protein